MNQQDPKDPRGEHGSLSRREVLKCMAWAGSGVVWTMTGGCASSALIGSDQAEATGSLSFVQISDSHIGFSKPANPNPLATLSETIARIKALPTQPDFVIHTGDITHLAKPEQFDTAQQIYGSLGIPVHFVPGEHDMVDGNNPRPYAERFAKDSKGDGWYSFDANGVHFVALVNVVRLGDKGMGTLGDAQLAWLKDDLQGKSSSTPIVVYSHFPMWALYQDWGWGTQDSLQAMQLLQRFGSVTALNGHIHQIQQKVEGNVTFHSGRSTAYPQPPPGQGPGPGPLVVPAEQLRANVGLTSVSIRQGNGALALTDSTLA
jgi:3',5'-cyclic AMP phosphodiesterase CpdA